MLFNARNLLISILILQLVLISLTGVSAGFDFFKKKEEKKNEVAADKKAQEPVAQQAQPEDELDDDDDDDDEQTDVRRAPAKPAESAIDRINKAREQKGGGAGRRSKKPDLDKIREAAHAQERFEAKQGSRIPARPSLPGGDGANKVQGRGRRAEQKRRQEEEAAAATAGEASDEMDGDEADEDEIENGDGHSEGGQSATNLLDRIKNNKMRNHAATKFVSTKPQGEASGLKKPNLSFLRSNPVVARRGETEADSAGLINGNIKKNKLITGSYWQKKIGSAYKATKKGIKESAKVISEIPQYVEKSMDSINAFLQLDSKGKVLALMDETSGDANFVRKEFSQFTLSWSPIMEKALDYLGDENLDKMKLTDKDELDLRRDALNSLAFGYEFMRLMIVWRENLLVAHEAFKSWLEAVKEEVEHKRLEMDENTVIQLRTTHSYMMLVTWMTIEKAAEEARNKLDYLMEVEDDRPKNYESEYFRNIVVLQELYEPTIEEFDKERNQIVASISESGVVADNLKGVDEFFESFRESLANGEVKNIDWEVPKELTDFLAKLEPQVRSTSLVYNKAFLKELGLRK